MMAVNLADQAVLGCPEEGDPRNRAKRGGAEPRAGGAQAISSKVGPGVVTVKW